MGKQKENGMDEKQKGNGTDGYTQRELNGWGSKKEMEWMGKQKSV